jgi:dipeptidyl aminopeptidase/acylaminoacyl peptidase
MDFVPCPACGVMNAGAAETCAECKAPLDAEPEAIAPLTFVAEPEDAAPEPAEPEVPQGPPPFEGPDAVKEQVAKLLADIAAKPEARALYLQLSGIYAQHGRRDLAAEVVQRALERDPQNTYLRHKLAQITGTPEARVEAVAPAAKGGFTPAVVGMAVRPAPPVFQKGRFDRRHVQIAAAAAALIVIAVLVKMLFFPDTRKLVGGEFAAHAPAWSPTGNHVAFLLSDSAGTSVAVYDLDKGEHRKVGPAAGWDEQAFAWSPDGRQLAYVREGGTEEWGGAIHVFDVVSGQDKKVAAGSSPAWRAGGTLLAVCSPESASGGVDVDLDEESAVYEEQDWSQRFCRIDAASGSVTRLALAAEPGMSLSPLLDQVVYERWSEAAGPDPDAEPPVSADKAVQDMADMATAGGSRNLAEASRNLGREVESRQYDAKRKAARRVDKVPSGVELLVADVDRAEPRTLAAAGQGAFGSWTPAGDRILMATNGSAGVDFVTVKPDGSDRQVVLAGVKGVDASSVRISRDGKWVFFVAPVSADAAVAKTMTGEGASDLFVAKVGGGEPERIENRHAYKQRYAVSPDGKRIVYEVREDVKILSGESRSELWITSR